MSENVLIIRNIGKLSVSALLYLNLIRKCPNYPQYSQLCPQVVIEATIPLNIFFTLHKSH